MSRLVGADPRKHWSAGPIVVVLLATVLVAAGCKDDPDPDGSSGAKGGTGGASAGGKSGGSGGKNSGGSVASGGNGDGGRAGLGDSGAGGAAGDDSAAGEDGAGGNGSAGRSGLGDSGAGGAAGDDGAGGGDAGGAGAGGEPQVLVPFAHINILSSPATIAVDAEYVYWTSSWVGADPPTPLPTRSGNYLMRVPKNGGEPSALFDGSWVVDGNPTQLALGATFAMDATHFYLPTSRDVLYSLIFKISKDGSSVEELAQPRLLDPKRQLVLTGGRLYFESGGGIDSVSVAGGPIVHVIDVETTPYPDGFDFFPAVNGLTTDGTNLYYSGNDQGMFKVPVGGGQPVLISPRNMPGALFSYAGSWPALAGGFVYWNYYGYKGRLKASRGSSSGLGRHAPSVRTCLRGARRNRPERARRRNTRSPDPRRTSWHMGRPPDSKDCESPSCNPGPFLHHRCRRAAGPSSRAGRGPSPHCTAPRRFRRSNSKRTTRAAGIA